MMKRKPLPVPVPRPSLLLAWFRVHTLGQYEALRVRALVRVIEKKQKRAGKADERAFQQLESCCRNLKAGQF